MQVSDLNNNLLNMITGQTLLKEGECQGKDCFADLLRLSEKQQSLAEKSPIETIKQKEFTVQVSQTEVKKPNQNIDRSVSADSSVSRESEVPSQSKSKTDKPEQNKSASQTKDSSEAKDDGATKNIAEEKQVASESVEEVADGQTENLLTENTPVVLLPMVSGEEILETGNIEPAMIVEETFADNMNENVAAVSENIVTTDDPTDELLPVSQKSIDVNENIIEPDADLPIDGKEDIQNQNIQSVAKETVNAEQKTVSESKPDEIIQLQEEKIAEVLPEDKKVEIKVSVKDDKVEAKSEKIVSDSVFEVTKVEEDVDFITTDENLAVKAEDSKKHLGTDNVEKVIAAPIVENKTIAQVEPSTVQMSTVNETETAIQSPAAVAAIANDTQTNTVVTETINLRDNYNKGITREVAEQIKVNITQSAIKGVDKIEIQLKPADLGQVEIKLHIAKDGRVQAQIIASNAETLELLQKDTDLLKEAFNHAGYQAEDGSFSFSHRGGEEAENEREKLREFIGEVITQDVAEEMAANDYISADGVNIRV